jgi:hypothetical protein
MLEKLAVERENIGQVVSGAVNANSPPLGGLNRGKDAISGLPPAR